VSRDESPESLAEIRASCRIFEREAAAGALAFILWVLALQRATPTRVANTMTVNPVAAALVAAWLVDEPITANLVVGLVAVLAGISIATTPGRSPRAERA